MFSGDSMQLPDYLVLVIYFAVLVAIGIWTSRRIKKQEDFFMGGRSFGKLLQTFAAFGAGTGSADPVNTASKTYISGLSGMWGVMYWLFVTPFYWITGVWYRRMRHLTLGDWFVERYESKALGFGYCIFGIGFFVVYGSMLFSAIGKVAGPLVGGDTVALLGMTVRIEYLLIPIIGLVVLAYGILGGLEAAYFTDLIQGLCIIFLSVILIPIGLYHLVERFGDTSTQSLWHGFTILHERLPEGHFTIVGTTSTSEFPWYFIFVIVVINLVGIVVQPHFIATGGGSAKTETNARVGLVTGNFLKRFCTIGWVLTALIALALFADHEALATDKDKTWGVASNELLKWGPGLRGLMLACLLAALMSSADAYMVIGSALVVRNIWAPYIDSNASEKTYVMLGRITGAGIVILAVGLSLLMLDVFGALRLTWVFGVIFAAPFWVGMYWRGATKTAAWCSAAFCVLVFFIIPPLAPLIPGLRDNPAFLGVNQRMRITETQKAAQTDVVVRNREIKEWDADKKKIEQIADASLKQKKLDELGPRPTSLKLGQAFQAPPKLSGGKSIFWEKSIFWGSRHGVYLVKNSDPNDVHKGIPLDTFKTDQEGNIKKEYLTFPKDTEKEHAVDRRGFGSFKVDFLLYYWMGLDLENMEDGVLATLDYPVKIIAPFLVMIFISFFTRRNSNEALDRYYAKMKTPVDPDPPTDAANLDASYANPEQFESKKLFPGTGLEFQKPTLTDIIGFVFCFALCFAIIGLAVFVANLGSW